MTFYDDDNSQYDIYAINSRSTYDPYYDDYYDAYTEQASTPVNSAQDSTQSSPTREPPTPTLPLSSYQSLSDDDIKAIAKRAVNDAFHRFNLLPHESKSSAESSRQQASITVNTAQDTTQPTPIREPSEPTSPRSIQEDQHPHTGIDVAESSANHVVESSISHIVKSSTNHIVEFSTNHVIESSTNRVVKSFTKSVVESSTVTRNVTTTPPTPIRIYAIRTSLTQAKSTANPASTTRYTPHTHTTYVFDPGGYARRHSYPTNQRPQYRPRHRINLHISKDDTHRTNHETAIALKPVDKPRAYNATTNNAEDVADEAYKGMLLRPTEGHEA